MTDIRNNNFTQAINKAFPAPQVQPQPKRPDLGTIAAAIIVWCICIAVIMLTIKLAVVLFT